MKRKSWTENEMELARQLLKKNSVIGQFYREKVMNGYTPPLDSPYARIRKYRKGF